MREFISNECEDDYVIGLLRGFASEIKTDKELESIIDKYAVALTAYMNGQVKNAEK